MSGAEDEAEVDFKNSHLFEILDRFENTIRIHVQLPITANGQPPPFVTVGLHDALSVLFSS